MRVVNKFNVGDRVKCLSTEVVVGIAKPERIFP